MTAASCRRILMTADAVGGVWSYALSLAEALGARAEILLAVMGPPPDGAQRAAAAAIPTLRVVEGDFRLEWMAGAERDLDAAAAWLRREAAAFRPDLLHVNGYAAAAETWPMPVVVVAHSCVLSWWQAVHGVAAPAEWGAYADRVARGLARADRVVAPSGAMLRELSRHYGVKGGMVIANGCVAQRFAAAEKAKIVLAAGRLWDEGKNLAALDAAAALTGWPIFAAGDRRHPDGRLIAPRRLVALGALAPSTLRDWMARAAIFAAPARYEPFGLSVLEAAASGCALVLGDIPSLRELWHEAALFVRPDEPAALAGAIDRLMADDAERRRLAGAARQRAERCSAAAMADRYAALYDEMQPSRLDASHPSTADAD